VNEGTVRTQPVPAGRWACLKAGLIDLAVGLLGSWFALTFALFVGLTLLVETFGEVPGESTIEDAIPIVLAGGPFVVAPIYFAVSWSRGTSVGMAASGIKLVRAVGEGTPGVLRGFARATLLLLLPWWLLLWGYVAGVILLAQPLAAPVAAILALVGLLPFASFAFSWRNELRQSFHDRVLGVRVVKR